MKLILNNTYKAQSHYHKKGKFDSWCKNRKVINDRNKRLKNFYSVGSAGRSREEGEQDVDLKLFIKRDITNNYNIVWFNSKLDGKLDFVLLNLNYYKELMILFKGKTSKLALSKIHQGVYYYVFRKIANGKAAKEVCDILKLSGESPKIKIYLQRREYERYEMSDSKSIKQYLSQVTYLLNRMRIHGEEIPDDKAVDKISCTMPIKFDQVVRIMAFGIGLT
ncbi:hypothetical protein CR513_59513, partial [Mucuna pruriens]